MILGREPVTMAEVKDIVDKIEGKEEIKQYLKTFTKLNKEKTLKLKEELRALNNLKIKEENVVKIADFLPKKNEDVNKIVTEVTLTEEETNAILNVVKKY
ncbi:MAG: hypothetical protein AABY10_05320 [Nanoarchaeota archaeon]